jgi:hypothetical protein
MILSSDELDIIEYLKSWNGKYIAMLEICRCAGGKQKFKASPNWAKNLMSRLVEAKLIEANDRGHYRFPVDPKAGAKPKSKSKPKSNRGFTVGDNYFPEGEGPRIIGDDYFPSTVPEDSEHDTKAWSSPTVLEHIRRAKPLPDDSEDNG